MSNYLVSKLEIGGVKLKVVEQMKLFVNETSNGNSES